MGSNLGDREAQIGLAIGALEQFGTVIERSGIYRTEPWKMDTEHWFYNQVILFETEYDPQHLLEQILEVERSLGRDRNEDQGEGYASRLIDIDILYFDDAVIDDDRLSVPHPRIQERRFVLAPMVELNASLVHPVLKQSQFELLKNCSDQSFLELV